MTGARYSLEAILHDYNRIIGIESQMPPEEFTRRTGIGVNTAQGVRDMEAEIKLLNEALRMAHNILEIRKLYRRAGYG